MPESRISVAGAGIGEGPSGFRRYQARRALAPMAVIAYVIVALSPPPAGSIELFPFFKWSLFSSASNPKTDVIVVVRSINGRLLPTPRPYYDLAESFSGARNRDTRLAKSLDRLALAVRSENTDLERSIRATVEGTFMREAESVEYDLVVIIYDPLERLRNGSLIRSVTLASYEKVSRAPE